jgi:hypothetical protein
MPHDHHAETMCYLDASRIQSPAGALDGVDLRGREDEKLGQIAGVLIDPQARRLRYFVVKSSGWFRPRRYLLPIEAPARIDPEGHAVRVTLSSGELARCEEFDRGSIREFGDEDVMAALFSDRAA